MTEELNTATEIVMHKTDDQFESIDIMSAVSEPFLSYSTSVIKDRALPDSRDGLKPVHRRILFAQHVMGNVYNKPYKKSARVVGDVIGKYHPHGDTAVYDTLVRLAQSWSLSAPLADGQGNFGSRDGDSAAAMRYTEIRMTKIGESMLKDINHDTVNFVPNYDGSEMMPEVFPTRFPNLIINGGEGIAVGMASKIPTHNPIEAMNCVIALVKAKLTGEDIPVEELINMMPSPDFPTGGLVHGLENYAEAWTKGRAKFKIRSNWIEEGVGGRQAIVITEIPYAVNKAKLVAKIDELRREHDEMPPKINGIFSVRDESSIDDGIRIVVKLKSGYDPEVVFNDLCKNTDVETHYSYNITVIKDGKPVTIGIKEAFETFIEFREEVIIKRTQKLLDVASKKKHTLDGLMKALLKLDETIQTIRHSKNAEEARSNLIELLDIDESQAADILAMRLQSLSSANQDEIKVNYDAIVAEIGELEDILGSKERQLEVLIDESEDQIDRFVNFKDPETKKKIFSKRRSSFQKELINISREDLIAREDCSIVMSNQGFIRRIPSSKIETQRRGTKGKSQMNLARTDFVQQTTVCHSHDTLAFVTDKGLVSFIRAFDIDTAERGVHINNLLTLEENEKILLFRTISEQQLVDSENLYVVLGTDKGYVKKTKLSLYNPNRRVAVRTINDRHLDDEKVIFFGISTNEAHLCLVSSSNRMIRHKVSELRDRSRSAGGVKGMRLQDDQKIMCGSLVEEEDANTANLGCVTKNGIIKVSKLDNYKHQKKGGTGLIAMNVEDNDYVLSAFIFDENEEFDVVTTTKKGVVNRVNLNQFRVSNRRTKGGRLVKLDNKKDELVSAFISAADSQSTSTTEIDIIESDDIITD
ncbi:DNA gyrase subunit A [Vibrio chagasii]|nr:DNA gyrase subunit A [Vibrio chagasii]